MTALGTGKPHAIVDAERRESTVKGISNADDELKCLLKNAALHLDKALLRTDTVRNSTNPSQEDAALPRTHPIEQTDRT